MMQIALECCYPVATIRRIGRGLHTGHLCGVCSRTSVGGSMSGVVTPPTDFRYWVLWKVGQAGLRDGLKDIGAGELKCVSGAPAYRRLER